MFSIDTKYKIIFALLITIAAIAWYWQLHNIPMIEPDSGGYINFSSSRTIGYPTFLWLINKLFGTLNYVPIVQLTILSFASFYCVCAVYSWMKNFIIAVIFLLLIMLNPQIKETFHILTEAISLSLLLIFLGVMISWFKKPSFIKLVTMSTLVGLSILVRPVHHAYIPAFLMLIILSPKIFDYKKFWQPKDYNLTPTKNFSVFILIVILFYSLGYYGQYRNHGIFQLETFAAHNLIGKVSLLPNNPNHHPNDHFYQEVINYSLPLNKYLQQFPKSSQVLLRAVHYDYFRYHYLSKIAKPENCDQLYKKIGWQIIYDYPLRYLQDVWINYYALWQLSSLLTEKEKNDLKQLVESIPYPYIEYPYVTEKKTLNNPLIVWSVRLMLGIIFTLSWVMIAKAMWSLIDYKKSINKDLLITSTASAIIQGHFILTAMVQSGAVSRYSLAMWPIIALLAVWLCKLTLWEWQKVLIKRNK